MEHTWPMLYKLTSTGKIQEWLISVAGNVMTTVHGQQGGKKQTDVETIMSGKNIGRKNETSPEEQAFNEARAKWEKKLKGEYVKTAEGALAGESSDLIQGGILPMLAHKYRDFPDKILFPAYTQPKLDGFRCIAIIKDGKCTLWSRKRNQITSVPHIVDAVEALGFKDFVLDGELFNPSYNDDFETISHLVKRDVPCLGGVDCDRKLARGGPCKGYTEVQYHVYDAVIKTRDFQERWAIVEPQITAWIRQRTVDDYPIPIVAVETHLVNSHEELMAIVESNPDSFLEQGYEGGMLRASSGQYEHKKGYVLLKIKLYDDDEFLVVDVKEGRGRMAGKAVFICRIPDDFGNPKAAIGAQFSAKMAGKINELKQYVDDPSLAIGREVTVQYQGFTNKERVPRFPVVLRFREDL